MNHIYNPLNTLTMRRVAEYYDFPPNRKDYIICPFHSERTPSLRIYEKSFHCFGCGAGSSIVDFVMLLFNLDYKTAAAKLNADFGLSVPPSFNEWHKAKQKQNTAAQTRSRLEELSDEYNKLLDIWAEHDKNKMKYAPEQGDNELHPLFAEAIVEMPRIECEIWAVQAEERELRGTGTRETRFFEKKLCKKL